MPNNICGSCGEHIPPRRKFCSSSCSAKFNNTQRKRTEECKAKTSATMKGMLSSRKGMFIKARVACSCYICGTKIMVIESKAHTNHICLSEKCSKENRSIAGRKSAASRTSRSKDEIKLFELCDAHFSNALSNHIISENWDADIVLPDQKIAILWNGPWHYKEMNISNHSLKQVKSRDKIKIKLFQSLGWNVYVFEDRHYTPEQAFVVVRAGTAPTSVSYELTASL